MFINKQQQLVKDLGVKTKSKEMLFLAGANHVTAFNQSECIIYNWNLKKHNLSIVLIVAQVGSLVKVASDISLSPITLKI